MNENTDFLRTDLLSAIAKDKEHGVDDVTLATAVRSDDRCEAFVERTQNLKKHNIVNVNVL